jgi:hypothetical protein
MSAEFKVISNTVMSYESVSEFPQGAVLKAVIELIELLGYQKFDDRLKSPDQKAAYYWFEQKDYKSHSAVTLTVHKSDDGPIVVYTRTNAARSYWDLIQQNKTLRLFRDLLNARFTTDAGRNRYWRPDKPLDPMTSGCYLARWRFKNALSKPTRYLCNRGFDEAKAGNELTGDAFLDGMNLRIFSNNLLLPYLVAVWEDYFKSTFAAVLKYSPQKALAIKNARLTHGRLESVASGSLLVEDAIAESFSFQRPKMIATNFAVIDSKFDLSASMRKPYRRRKKSLFDTIDAYVNNRNEFVHTGTMDLTLTDAKLKAAMKDFEVTIDRCYDAIAKHFGFKTISLF